MDPTMSLEDSDLNMSNVAKLGVQERNKIWMENKQNKLQAERDRKANTNDEECTFKPQLMTQTARSRKRDKVSTKSVNSMAKYIARMEKSRKDKEDKKKEDENRVGSGNNWTGRATVPKAPKINQATNRKRREMFERDMNPHNVLNERNPSGRSNTRIQIGKYSSIDLMSEELPPRQEEHEKISTIKNESYGGLNIDSMGAHEPHGQMNLDMFRDDINSINVSLNEEQSRIRSNEKSSPEIIDNVDPNMDFKDCMNLSLIHI